MIMGQEFKDPMKQDDAKIQSKSSQEGYATPSFIKNSGRKQEANIKKLGFMSQKSDAIC